jgi:ketosteroid isomerase-like protein
MKKRDVKKPTSPEDVVRAFIDLINAHDNREIFNLKSADFVFVDSGGDRYGRSQVDWGQYYQMFPDYTIRIEEIMTKGDTVVVLGSFSQTYAVNGELREENHYGAPAVWRAIVKRGLVSLWQVYTDHTKTWEIINKNKKNSKRGA